MKRVVLFKTPGPTDSDDPYRQCFGAAGYQLNYVPVLQEVFQTDDLSSLLQDEVGNVDWAGVVITSKRGVEGWIRAARSSAASGSARPSWNTVQLFTVGSSSIEHLASAQTTLPLHLQLDAKSAVQAKSASELLPLLTARRQGSYLIIRGDKSTEELQLGLTAAGREYRETTVYTTSPRPSLRGDIDAMGELDSGWMVFFSPSSAEWVLPLLPARLGLGQYRIAAIGLTTERFLVQQGLQVSAVAEEPTAEGLLRAIQSSDSEKPKGGAV